MHSILQPMTIRLRRLNGLVANHLHYNSLRLHSYFALFSKNTCGLWTEPILNCKLVESLVESLVETLIVIIRLNNL